MEEVEGDATFKSFPGESFRFGVSQTDGIGEIWLKSQASKKRWACKVTNVAAFAPADVVLPLNTVLHYVVANLMESDDAHFGLNLVRGDNDKTLQLEVLIKLGAADLTWAPKYVFPLTLTSHMTPMEAQAEQLALLKTHVQELQQEVQTLKQQMHRALQKQCIAQPAATPSLACSISRTPRPSSELVIARAAKSTLLNQETASKTASCGAKARGQTQHRLVQTGEIREIRNAHGVVLRSVRQHTCKVCSLLRGGYKRPAGTPYYCLECTERFNGGMVFLCDKVRPHEPTQYKNVTCSQIWHLMWNNGETIPLSGTSAIRMRKRKKESHPGESEPNLSTVLSRTLP